MKKVSVLLLTAAAFLVVVLLSIKFTVSRNSAKAQNSSSNILYNSTPIMSSSQGSSEINAMASQTSQPVVYTVKEYEGGIGVFYNGDIIPIQKIDVDVSSLPSADQNLLRDGIKVYSVDKLNQIIEDYES